MLIRPPIRFITPALGSNPSCLQAKVGFTPRTSRPSIAVPHRNTSSHLHSLLWPIESSQVASACFCPVEGSCLIRRELTETRGQLANSTQKSPSAGETSLLCGGSDNHCTATSFAVYNFIRRTECKRGVLVKDKS